jgi:hypothetical protein
MNRDQVIPVLESLANGVDPATGTRIPLDAFHTADTVRALFAAATLLRERDTPPKESAPAPPAPAGPTKKTPSSPANSTPAPPSPKSPAPTPAPPPPSTSAS